MRLGYANHWIITLAMSAAALATTGCELIPGLIGGAGGPAGEPGSTTAELAVNVERLDGIIEGVPLETSLGEAAGVRAGDALAIDVFVSEQDRSIHISTPGTASSDQNPYASGVGDPGFPDAGFPRDEPVGRETDGTDTGGATIVACSPLLGCRRPDDFALEIQQLADGRSVLMTGAWNGGDHVELELRYREPR